MAPSTALPRGISLEPGPVHGSLTARPRQQRAHEAVVTSHSWTRPGLGGLIYMGVALTLGGYFAFAAIQGDYGVLRAMQIANEISELKAERDGLAMDLAGLKNLTHRLSDDYLDLDLLDEQVRNVLGYVRADEIVIR